MGNEGITVHLKLEEMLERDPDKEYPELKKNIGEDTNILVSELFEYMVNPEGDQINPEGYNPNQKDVARIVNENYSMGSKDPSFYYETLEGKEKRMYFKDKLSKYEDAFRPNKENDFEFGDISEITNSHVYLTAWREAIGGKR